MRFYLRFPSLLFLTLPGVLAPTSAARAATGPATSPAPTAASPVDPPTTRPIISPDNLLNFLLVDGFLVVQTTLPHTDGEQSLSVPSLPGDLTVMIPKLGKRPDRTQPTGLYTPDSITLMYTEKDAERLTRTSILTAINQLSISRDSENGDLESSIQYIQSARPQSPDLAVRLFIQTFSAAGLPANQNFTAESFLSFIRKYPAQTTLYLRPMVERFRPMPHLFRVDESIAADVFPEVYEPDRDARQKVRSLVRQLDADDFQKRQAAATDLRKLGTAAAAPLSQLDRSSLTLEQATQVDAILLNLKSGFQYDPKLLRNDPGFLLDCLMSDNAALRAAAAAQLRQVTGQSIPLPQSADAPSRILAVYKLRQQLLIPTTRP